MYDEVGRYVRLVKNGSMHLTRGKQEDIGSVTWVTVISRLIDKRSTAEVATPFVRAHLPTAPDGLGLFTGRY